MCRSFLSTFVQTFIKYICIGVCWVYLYKVYWVHYGRALSTSMEQFIENICTRVNSSLQKIQMNIINSSRMLFTHIFSYVYLKHRSILIFIYMFIHLSTILALSTNLSRVHQWCIRGVFWVGIRRKLRNSFILFCKLFKIIIFLVVSCKFAFA